MGLIEEKSNQNESFAEHIKPANLSQAQKFVIEKVHIESQFDKFKNKDIERVVLTLYSSDNNRKIFTIQNKANAERLKWNFGDSHANWTGKSITLYKIKIEVSGKIYDSIRIQYNIIDT